MFTGNEGLADGLLPESQHATMSPHLVYEGLKHHPLLHVALLVLQLVFLHLLCIRGLRCLSLYSRTHPPLALTTLRWALASSRTHTQCGGGTMWQGHVHTQTHTADPQRTGRGISNEGCRIVPQVIPTMFSEAVAVMMICFVCAVLLRFCWSKTKDIGRK